jgi:hypothetical protein
MLRSKDQTRSQKIKMIEAALFSPLLHYFRR